MSWNLPETLHSNLLEGHVELMHLSSCLHYSNNAWSQSKQLVLSLLGELDECGPLGFDLIGWLPEASALVASVM